jgi:hypothetical protein
MLPIKLLTKKVCILHFTTFNNVLLLFIIIIIIIILITYVYKYHLLTRASAADFHS